MKNEKPYIIPSDHTKVDLVDLKNGEAKPKLNISR
jgi:hypothetical protein